MMNRRILIVDDNESLHEDFKKILMKEENSSNEQIKSMEDSLFGKNTEKINNPIKTDSAPIVGVFVIPAQDHQIFADKAKKITKTQLPAPENVIDAETVNVKPEITPQNP